jgi:tRNA G18 (ribose-2'-O)-methylase SpoU
MHASCVEIYPSIHPRCVYVLGAEDQGLPPAVVRACTHCVSLECSREASFNVAVAGSLIMYDRLRKRTEHAQRVGGDVGGQRRLQAETTAPRLR